MNRQTMKSVLRKLGLSAGKYNVEFRDSGENIQFCCPFHGERRPSAGIHVYNETGKCFACDETFNLPKLIAHCMDFRTFNGGYNYYKANMWLEENFNVEYRPYELERKLTKIDEGGEQVSKHINPATGRFELPKLFLAPFRGGKLTHNYFFERGFTKETMQKFDVGWDRTRLRITVPVYWEDGTPCGLIGRVVLPERVNGKLSKKYKKYYPVGNETRYYIYENFPTGEILFPLTKFKPREDGLAVLVEGQYDCMWMHQLGFDFTLSSLGSKLAYHKQRKLAPQIEILKRLGVTKVLLLRDNDKAGLEGIEHDAKLLKAEGIIPFVTDYPEGKNDPQELTKEEVVLMLDNMRVHGRKKLTRIN